MSTSLCRASLSWPRRSIFCCTPSWKFTVGVIGFEIVWSIVWLVLWAVDYPGKCALDNVSPLCNDSCAADLRRTMYTARILYTMGYALTLVSSTIYFLGLLSGYLQLLIYHIYVCFFRMVLSLVMGEVVCHALDFDTNLHSVGRYVLYTIVALNFISFCVVYSTVVQDVLRVDDELTGELDREERPLTRYFSQYFSPHPFCVRHLCDRNCRGALRCSSKVHTIRCVEHGTMIKCVNHGVSVLLSCQDEGERRFLRCHEHGTAVECRHDSRFYIKHCGIDTSDEDRVDGNELSAGHTRLINELPKTNNDRSPSNTGRRKSTHTVNMENDKRREAENLKVDENNKQEDPNTDEEALVAK